MHSAVERKENRMLRFAVGPVLMSGVCGVALALAALAPAGSAQEASGSNQEAASDNAAAAAAFAAVEAKRYDLRHSNKAPAGFELAEQPLLRWSNPTDGEVHGSVYLWTEKGCPEAVASIYKFFDREQINIELVSLSEFPYEARRNGRLRWTPEAGVAFKALPDAPAAAETAERRQLQMRSIARRFTGALADRGDGTTLTQLRLMARPLHTYKSSDDGREGALFALVSTTDPEILLMVESRKTEAGRKWMFAAARMHFCRLQLKCDDKVVWEAPQAAPPWEPLRGPKGQYVILQWHSEEEAAADKADP
jgi:hypothetical protein